MAGWTDFLDEKVFDGVGHIASGMGNLVSHGADAAGLPDWVGNLAESQGEFNEYILGGAGNFITPAMDLVGNATDAAFSDFEIATQSFENFTENPTWDNFLATGDSMFDQINDNNWDFATDTAQSFGDAWNTTIDDASDMWEDIDNVWGTDFFTPGQGDWMKLDDVTGFMNDHRDLIGPLFESPLGMAWDAARGGNPFGSLIGALGGIFGGGGGNGGGGGGGWGNTGGGGGGGGPVQQGMNRAQAQSVVEALTADRANLQSLIEAAAHSVHALEQAWKGPDSQRFASEFASSRKQMDQAVHMIEQMAKTLTAQIGAQESTSSS